MYLVKSCIERFLYHQKFGEFPDEKKRSHPKSMNFHKQLRFPFFYYFLTE